MPAQSPIRPLLPGILVVCGVTALSIAGGRAETMLFGRATIEPLVLAILIGMALGAAGATTPRAVVGVRFAAKDILELSVCLLGATMDVPRLFASGPALACAIAVLVCLALAAGVLIGRLLGLSPNLSVLIACGNAICGNSAIAAVAPAIAADRDEVAASIALAAVLGVVEVLFLPFLILPFGLSHYQYGVLAGLSVYAVPQVLAAAFAVSTVSGQVATVVKLARVLMLGPAVVFFAVRARRGSTSTLSFKKVVPWFVMGFIGLAALRSAGVVPDFASNVTKSVSGWLMIAAMAGLGLGVDVRTVRQTGGRVLVAIVGSLFILIVLSLVLIHALALR